MTIIEPPALSAPPMPRRFTRTEYYQMYDLGLFQNQRVELIDGEIIRMSPQNSPHALTVAIVTSWLVKTLGEDYTVRCQLPLVASEWTEPEPDFAVLAGAPETQTDHPRTSPLIIEIAATTLAYDRKKAAIYAAAKVAEYWIINLRQRRLEVYRHPIADKTAPHGYAYREMITLKSHQQVKPLRLPMPAIEVARLFPPR